MKTISDLGQELNKMAAELKLAVNDLQALRKASKSGGMNRGIFAKRNKKSLKYLFHYGGLKELQFNVGVEANEIENTCRYGLAFSLQPYHQQLPKPVEFFRPKINRFNEYISEHKDEFMDFQMWHYRQPGKEHLPSDPIPVGPIPENWIQQDNFIFIGKRFHKPYNQLKRDELEKILLTFDKMLPIYKHVEIDLPTENEKNICRLCWNDNGWEKPSGWEGKAKSGDSYECKNGFGHEEWLFDISRNIDGWQYGFLQPVMKYKDYYVGKTLDLYLYTINSTEKQKYWVGKLKNVEVISDAESQKIYKIYKEKGWLKEMQANIKDLKLTNNLLQSYSQGESFVNVRFKATEKENLFENLLPISKTDNPIKGYYYQLYDIPIDFEWPDAGEYNDDEDEFDFDSGDNGKTLLKRTAKKTFEKRTVENKLVHNEISDLLLKDLQHKYGENNVRRECKAPNGCRVDMVVKTPKGKYKFYEIKTYQDLRTNIRVALGQILEYAYWYKANRAEELIIVSDLDPADKAMQYLKNLSETFNLPIKYQKFDKFSGKLID